MSNIKHNKGKVTYVMRTGKTFVRNTMTIGYARLIISRGKNVEEVDKRGVGVEICVDNKYFFPVEVEKEEPTPKKSKKIGKVNEND